MGHDQVQTTPPKRLSNVLIDRLSSLLNDHAPGHEAQNLLAPGDRIPPNNWQLEKWNTRHAGVMVLLFQERDSWHTLLIKKPRYPGVHSNQIAFPGGKRERQDPDLLSTAVRETHEEVGLFPDRIRHIGPLSPLYVPPSNFLIHPFTGLVEGTRNWRPEEAEVALVIEMPVAVILGTDHISYREVNTRYGKMKVPSYEYDGHVIWGATGMILAELAVALEWAGLR